MPSCPSCQCPLAEQGSFCSYCGVQVRCQKCQESLTLGARFCAMCGNATNGIEASNSLPLMGGPINKIDYKSKHSEFHAQVTNEAMIGVSEPLAMLIAYQAGITPRQNNRSIGKQEDPQLDLPGFDPGVQADTSTTLSTIDLPAKALPEGAELTLLRNVFRFNEDGLKLINSRLKQRSQRDFVSRLTTLFLYAHELAGREMIPRTELNAILDDAKVNDGNARSWIAKTDYLTIDQNSVGLSVPGREFAQDVIKQFADPNFETKWTFDSRSTSHTRKSSGKENSEVLGLENKLTKGRRQKGTSYGAQIRKLFDESFFSKKRAAHDVQAEMEKRGHKFPLGRISEALTRLTKSENLYRNKNEEGVWLFQNKHAK